MGGTPRPCIGYTVCAAIKGMIFYFFWCHALHPLFIHIQILQTDILKFPLKKTGWENLIKDHTNFPLVYYFINSDILFPGWCTDNIRREFMLHIIGTKGLIFQKHLPCPKASVQNLCKGLTKTSLIENYGIPQKRPVLTPLSVKPVKLHRSINFVVHDLNCQDPLHRLFPCGMLKNNACNVSWWKCATLLWATSKSMISSPHTKHSDLLLSNCLSLTQAMLLRTQSLEAAYKQLVRDVSN